MGSIRRLPRGVFLAALSLLALDPVVRADEVTLTPSRDTTMFSESGAVSNGAGMFLFAGSTAVGNRRRGLMAFDVAGNLPPGSTIDSVSLTMQMSRSTSAAGTVALHRVLADWGEGTSDAGANEGGGAAASGGDATWTHAFFDTTPWASAGGEVAPGASAIQPVAGPGVYVWESTAQLVADVQSWLDTPANNFGWLLRGDESANRTAKRFNSRENGVAGTRPRLTIVFTPSACAGDCNGDNAVTIDELALAVSITLGQTDVGVCRSADGNADGRVIVNELVAAVDAALRGCSAVAADG